MIARTLTESSLRAPSLAPVSRAARGGRGAGGGGRHTAGPYWSYIYPHAHRVGGVGGGGGGGGRGGGGGEGGWGGGWGGGGVRGGLMYGRCGTLGAM